MYLETLLLFKCFNPVLAFIRSSVIFLTKVKSIKCSPSYIDDQNGCLFGVWSGLSLWHPAKIHRQQYIFRIPLVLMAMSWYPWQLLNVFVYWIAAALYLWIWRKETS